MTNETKHAGNATAGSDRFAGSPPARSFDTNEDSFWRNKYEHEGYFQKGMTYDDYEPAYRFGYEAHKRWKDRTWDDVERDMGGEWAKVKAKSRLKWEHAKHAVRAAWDRLADSMHDKKHGDKMHTEHR
jgi:hypothetical protein